MNNVILQFYWVVVRAAMYFDKMFYYSAKIIFISTVTNFALILFKAN